MPWKQPEARLNAMIAFILGKHVCGWRSDVGDKIMPKINKLIKLSLI